MLYWITKYTFCTFAIFLLLNYRTMNIEKTLTVGECCCFDLMTGGLIIGYIELLFSMIPIFYGVNNPFTISFLLKGLYFQLINLYKTIICRIFHDHRNKSNFRFSIFHFPVAMTAVGIGFVYGIHKVILVLLLLLNIKSLRFLFENFGFALFFSK